MKKYKRYFAVLISLLIAIFPFSFISANELTEMPYDEDVNVAVDNIIQSIDFSIFAIGPVPDTLSDCLTFKESSSLENVSSSSKYNSVWVFGEACDNLLQQDSTDELENLLNKGYSLYFFGIEELHLLSKRLINSNYEEELLEDSLKNTQVVTFVTKNKSGEYFFGHIFSETGQINESVKNVVLASAWNRRNDYNYTRENKTTQFASLFNEKVEASYGDDFSIGSKWDCVFGWNQYNWTTSNSWGTYSEWKAGFYLADPIDTHDYWAMAIEGAMQPNQYVFLPGYYYHSKSLYYDSHADCNGQINLLRSYSPKASPSSDTMTLSVGLGVTGASIAASWTVESNDLTLADTTNVADQFMKIKFNYRANFFTDYCHNTSWQNIAIIYQSPDDATSCKFGNGRTASFYNYWLSSESTTTNWYTTLYR